MLYNEVLLRREFSETGAVRFMQDVLAIQGVIDLFIPYGSGSAPGIHKLREAAALLSLPSEAEEGRRPYKQACDEIFGGKKSAEDALENLGMTHLNNNDARLILARRIEQSSEWNN